MSIEVSEPIDGEPTAPSPVSATAPAFIKRKSKEKEDEREDKREEREGSDKQSIKSPVLRAIQIEDHKSIADIISQLGGDSSYKIAVHRKEPPFVVDPATARRVRTEGHLQTYDGVPVDEVFISERHGGGKYVLRFMTRDVDGRMKFVTARTIQVAGEPRLDDNDLNRNVAPATPAPATPSGPTQPDPGMKMALEIMGKQLDRAQSSSGGESSQVMALVTKQLDALREENKDLRAEMVRARDHKPPEDPFQKKMLESLLDGDSARITQIRTTHESEIRTLKESHAHELRAIRDRFDLDLRDLRDRADRDRADMKASHEREIGTLRAANDLMIKTMQHSNEVTLAATKSSTETQIENLKHQNRQLEREITDTKSDVKELRAIKDKPLLQQMKEINELKDAMGGDETEKGGLAQVVEAFANPQTLETIGQIIRPVAAAVPTANPSNAQAQAQATGRPQIVRGPNNTRFRLEADGKTITPVKVKKKTVSAPAAEGAPEMPAIDEDRLKFVVALLEKAYQGNQDPDVVAQSYKLQVPEEVLQTIRVLGDQHGSMDRGIDAFMSKVAKLQGSSPLSSQGGRNWIRKVGKALVGSE